MKGSRVVQGLKSLLHPQLPLSPKESQRLLTALTSSFRRQLDEAHPREVDVKEANQEPPDGATSRTPKQQLHSSAASLADRHLASVLTNPLLAKSERNRISLLDQESAKIELHKNPSKDPLLLLEEYHEKGAATIAIAVLCLQRFKEFIGNLPEKQRPDEILARKAGQRTLLWLWNNNFHESDALVDDVRLMDLMVPFVMKEGSESYLWDWFQTEMILGTQIAVPGAGARARAKHHRYRWKARMLRAIVKEKIDQNVGSSTNAALDAVLKACAMKERAVNQGLDAFQYPLSPAAMLLANALWQSSIISPNSRANADPERYDQYLEQSGLYFGGIGADAFIQFHRAKLLLCHPRSPSPLAALRFFKRLFAYPQPEDEQFHQNFLNPKDEQTARSRYFVMIRTAAQLEDHAQMEDADWIISQTRQIFPNLAIHLNEHLQRERLQAPSSTAIQEEAKYLVPRQTPFPAFT